MNENKQKNKFPTVFAVVALVVLALSAVFFTFTKDKLAKEKENPVPLTSATAVFDPAQSTYKGSPLFEGTNPVFSTPFDGVFYSPSLDSTVSFFTFSDGKFTKITAGVKQTDITVTCSHEKIPVTLYSVERNGETFGCGIFTNDGTNNDVLYYDYAFFCLREMPEALGDGLMLAVDFDKTAFAKSEKLFSELFSFDPETGKTKLLFHESTRTVEHSGALRNDWVMVTDSLLDSFTDEPYFLSGRFRSLADKGKIGDLFYFTAAEIPEIAAKDVTGSWLRATENGILFLRSNENGFSVVELSDKKESVRLSFEGDYFDDYLACGNFVINKKTCILTNLISGENTTLENIDLIGYNYFSMSPDGKRAVFAADGVGNSLGTPVQRLVQYNIETGESTAYKEPLLFIESAPDFVWCDNSTYIHLRTPDGIARGMYSFTF